VPASRAFRAVSKARQVGKKENRPMRSLTTARPFTAARLRPAAGAMGGASSLLRLSSAPRLPQGPALGQWIGRAARALAQGEG
jgi:hypothetical protein